MRAVLVIRAMCADMSSLGSVDYAKAFSACRRHRIDMNVLVDHDREAFMKNLSVFVDQVKDVDFINLFLTSLGYVRSRRSCNSLLMKLPST